MLDHWHNKLKVMGALSQATIDHRKRVPPTLERIHKFKSVRNSAFYFGDPLQDPVSWWNCTCMWRGSTLTN